VDIKIKGKRYRVVFRHVIECRIMPAGKAASVLSFLGAGKSKCNEGAGDFFDIEKGERLALNAAIDDWRALGRTAEPNDKYFRREFWNEFLYKTGVKARPVATKVAQIRAESELVAVPAAPARRCECRHCNALRTEGQATPCERLMAEYSPVPVPPVPELTPAEAAAFVDDVES
jgi:hypothetical protein